MSKMARDKGKRGEREIADRFIEIMESIENKLWSKVKHSQEVKRNTLQSDRGGFDLVGIPGLAIEIKRCETLALGSWWSQCLAQARHGLMPVLFYRQSRKPWMVRTYTCIAIGPSSHWVVSDFEADGFFKFYEQYYTDLISVSINKQVINTNLVQANSCAN